MKLFSPDGSPIPVPERYRRVGRRRKRAEIPRCRCGCGRPAQWPSDREPLFYSRLCGYLMAVDMVRIKEAEAQ